jgi:hypothetical protein
MLIQPGQHFSFSGVAGWAPVDLYIVVRRTVVFVCSLFKEAFSVSQTK